MVQGSGFRNQGLGFRVQGLWFRVYGVGCPRKYKVDGFVPHNQGVNLTIVREHNQSAGTAAERTGNNLKSLHDFNEKATARIWS